MHTHSLWPLWSHRVLISWLICRSWDQLWSDGQDVPNLLRTNQTSTSTCISKMLPSFIHSLWCWHKASHERVFENLRKTSYMFVMVVVIFVVFLCYFCIFPCHPALWVHRSVLVILFWLLPVVGFLSFLFLVSLPLNCSSLCFVLLSALCVSICSLSSLWDHLFTSQVHLSLHLCFLSHALTFLVCVVVFLFCFIFTFCFLSHHLGPPML